MVFWTDCEVTRAGPAENGAVYVALRAVDNSFHNWYVAVPQMEREILATALTAVNSGKLVNAHLTGEAELSTINRLYIIA